MRSTSVLLLALVAGCATTPSTSPPAAPEAGGDAGPAAEDQELIDNTANIAGSLEASQRVDELRIEPSPIVITRGDTIQFRGVLTDADGNRIEGARWAVSADPSVFEVESIKEREPDTYLLWGTKPGETLLRLWLPAVGDTVVNWSPAGQVAVRVEDWPAASIEIDPLPYGSYVGSAFPLSARVLTVRGTEHSTATVKWASSAPEVASVSKSGILTLRSEGRARLTASVGDIEASLTVEARPSPVAAVHLSPATQDVRTGDVLHLEAKATDRRGRTLGDVQIAYSVTPVTGPEGGAWVDADGAFVAEEPGVYRVLATAAGGRSASAVVDADARDAGRPITLVGRGPVPHVETSDLWVFEGRDGRDYVYTGTHAQGGGDRMFAWDVTDPSNPVLTDSVVVDARVVNDVKVNEDATWAVITREGASDRKNGIVVLDLADPAHPTVLSTFTENLTAGVHNVWIEGEVVYAVNDGTRALHILDLSDPANPAHVGRWEVRPGEEDKTLHDVWAKDGLAYLSYWDDGLVILDIGAGIEGGTPSEPAFVSSLSYRVDHGGEYGNTHTAFRWGDYVFVGDEIFGCGDCVNGPRGFIHVIDVSDIRSPEQVATYRVPEAGTHNIWVEDGLLYVAYYQGGVRVVDVSGELRGELYGQGREVAWYHTSGEEGEAIVPNAPLAWGPQPHKGHIYASDMNSGLWVLTLGQ